MKPTRLLRPMFYIALILTMGLGYSFGDEEESQDEEAKADVTIDTCGKLAGRLVTLTVTMKHEYFNRGNERFDADFTIGMAIPAKARKDSDTDFEVLLQWSSSSFGNGVEAPERPAVNAQNNSLKLGDAGTPLGDFVYKKDRLWMTPEFRKKIIQELEKESPEIQSAALLEILEGSEWPEKHILQVLRLYAIRDSIRNGFVDGMIATLQTMFEEPVDDTIARYCKRLSDSLIARKKNDQPLKLEAAKRIGAILTDPIYPPLDSPSVFWRDGLLAVVQDEATSPRMMRTFDPRTGKWGKKVPLKFPETALSKLFVKNTGTYSMACQYETFCWRDKLGEFNDDPCDGLDCSPLILLDDSTNGGSLQNVADLAKAGGSCAAGWGQYEFRNGGSLYFLGDDKLSWVVIPGAIISGTREYGFELKRDYPVVVSPDQNWVAYALNSDDGKRKELWVARLKYKSQ